MGLSSLDATKAWWMRAVCAERAARESLRPLVRRVALVLDVLWVLL
jgi:hypothetical protein